MTEFVHFWGHSRERIGDKAVFSQWYESPFHCDGNIFPTAEHWMMHQKALLFDDHEMAAKILTTLYPRDVKTIGRKVANFYEELWDQEKTTIVRLGNILKFSQNAELEGILLDTGDAVLVEASPYDSIWGIGMKDSHPNAYNPSKWKGENLLGFVLMDVRKILGGETPTTVEEWT